MAELSRRELRKQEVRGRISEAALQLFAEKGCDDVTVEEICELAAVARKTFYNYYPSKPHLIRELSEALFYDETRNVVELAMEKHQSTADRLAAFCHFMVDNMTNYEALERSLVQQTLLDLSSDQSRGGEQLRLLNQAFAMLLEDGRQRGDVNPKLSIAFMAEMVVGSMCALVLNWMHDPDYPLRPRIDELGQFMVDSFTV